MGPTHGNRGIQALGEKPVVAASVVSMRQRKYPFPAG